MALTVSTAPSPPIFDPFTQSFSLLLSDGTPVKISVPDLDEFILYNVQICINYSSQLGASLLLLVVLLILTRSEKRRSPIFIINALALAINTTRSVLQCLYFTGPFSEVYAYFAQDYSRVTTSAEGISIAGSVLTLLLLICVQLSLILQTIIICTTVRDIYRHCIAATSVSVALVAIGFRFALVVENSKFIINADNFSSFAWLGSATNITATISICFYCAVFITKLGFALRERRKLGLQQFGPMQIIFIMGCQTLIIPGKLVLRYVLVSTVLMVTKAIFSVLQNFTTIPEMGSNVLTLVAIFLPLSSMWASFSIDAPSQASSSPDSHRKIFGSYSSGSTHIGSASKPFSSTPSPTDTTFTQTNNSPNSSPVTATARNDENDLEAQACEIDLIDHKSRFTSGEV
ncbi:MAG: hypothetical protein M1836_006877 [Candelina mexicana]|nr:MAG: hypothetical protein M1836_006877 [Candelina mexicana]